MTAGQSGYVRGQQGQLPRRGAETESGATDRGQTGQAAAQSTDGDAEPLQRALERILILQRQKRAAAAKIAGAAVRRLRRRAVRDPAPVTCGMRARVSRAALVRIGAVRAARSAEDTARDPLMPSHRPRAMP